MSSLYSRQALPWAVIAEAVNAEAGFIPRAGANRALVAARRGADSFAREARPTTLGAAPWSEIAASLNEHGGIASRAEQALLSTATGPLSGRSGAGSWDSIAAGLNHAAGFETETGAMAGPVYVDDAPASPSASVASKHYAYDPRIDPFSQKIQAEYKAAGRPFACGDLWCWLAEKYPPPNYHAMGR
jgi:hypothetical protein